VKSEQGKELWQLGGDGFCWSGHKETVKAVFEMIDLPETPGLERLPEILDRVLACLWATHVNDVGRIKSMQPVKIIIDATKGCLANRNTHCTQKRKRE